LQQSGHVLLLAVLAQLLSTAAGFGIPLVPRQQEWNDYTASHAGKWRGVWTTYDPSGVQQGEADRVDTTLDLSSDGTHMRHMNTLYVGSVGSECDTCFDSVETKEVLVEECTKDKFRQRASGAAYLSGPGVARRGDMMTEVGFRDGDRRVRCIISHRPQFNGREPPSQLALERIVIVRETQALREDVSPSVEMWWSEVGQSDCPGLWRGRSMVLGNDVEVGVVSDAFKWTEEELPPSNLDECRCCGAAESSHVSLNLDGGISIDAPAIVSAGEPAELGVRWTIGPRNAVGATRKRVVQTKVRLEALTRIVDTARGAAGVEQCTISPPKLLRFAVENLEPVEVAA
ncbi:unnamed protein product, partial [Laminaria digitata]